MSEEEFFIPFRSQNNLVCSSLLSIGRVTPLIKPTRSSFRRLCVLVGESGLS